MIREKSMALKLRVLKENIGRLCSRRMSITRQVKYNKPLISKKKKLNRNLISGLRVDDVMRLMRGFRLEPTIIMSFLLPFQRVKPTLCDSELGWVGE